MNVLVLHYSHPEGYPPSLNAINCIAEEATQLTVLFTETLPTIWNYKTNIKLIALDAPKNRFEALKRSKFEKLNSYLNYIKTTRRLIKTNSYDLVVIYDDVPFLLYRLSMLFLSKNHKLWYHNHDVYPLTHYKKYSINWFAAINTQRYFKAIDYFSLPAVERKKMYPLENFKGTFFYLPNYPSTKIIKYNADLINQRKNDEISIIYPGSPSHKNGFEELVDVLGEKILNRQPTLTIVGDLNPKYKNSLMEYAKKQQVESFLIFKDRIPYTEMSNFLQQYHVGWGVYKPVDLSVATAGSSSNKIYEFMANSMPVIVFDNEHHREHLENCKAVFFSNLTKKSLINEITNIANAYNELVVVAKKEFEEKYQFERKFNPVLQIIKKDLSLKNG